MKVNKLEHILGQDWDIAPAGGATGEAFMAQFEEQRLFLKRNSSPFLAVLSAEGIVPKLVWTRRLENGDVITAQKWMEGRELNPEEMVQERVAKLLHKIHFSTPLLTMLKMMGKRPVEPENLLNMLNEKLDYEIRTFPIIKKCLQFIYNELANVKCDQQVVCHCDVNHNNWLLSKNNQLYLIDWDGPIIGDPAIDLGMILYSYIPSDRWEEWMDLYGMRLTDELKLRMKWYVIIQTIFSLQWHKEKGQMEEVEKDIQFLSRII